MKRKILLVMMLLIMVYTGLPRPTYQKDNPFISSDGYPLVMAHAGGKGVYPDNTLKAFKYAYNLGVDVLEMDVQLTSDDVLVLLHGENETGNTKSHSNCDTVVWKETYTYLKETCNFGYYYEETDGTLLYQNLTKDEWISEEVYLPTLEEVFTLFGNDILYNIEIKADSDAPRNETADALIALIESFELESHVLVATAFDDISLYIVENYPNILLSTSYGSAESKVIGVYTFSNLFQGMPLYAAVQTPTSYEVPVINRLSLDTKLLIYGLNRQNMAMHYWTINDEKTMRELIEKGADGIITDDPALLISIIDEYRNE
jgi:glycerophosphoryl diester phosphodiesterase